MAAATSWPTGALGWTSFLVVSFILGYLAHPPAHVLNRLYDRVYAERRRRDGDPALEYVRAAAHREVSAKDSLYAWAKSEVGASSKEAMARIELFEGVSKMFRTLTLLSVVASGISLVAKQWTYSSVLLLIAVASFLVFAERRFAATKEVYQRFRRVHEQKTPSTIIMRP